ncbi:MAG: Bug family tripartite tricarboxylate transporter substrate binding protein [Acetobacteraceae bacterium]
MRWKGLGAALVALAGMVCAAGTSHAQANPNWPVRPVKIIVPYAPGGSTDNAVRPVADRLSHAFGQQFVVENRGGASGTVGTEAGVRSAPDGYTFFVVPVATATIVPAARKLSYDAFKDMVPVSRIFDNTLVVAIHPSIPAKTMQEFVAYTKANPGKLAFGSSGLGTMTQMICELTKASGKLDMLHVPYRGGGEALGDFLAGHVQVYCEGNVMPHAKTGKARLLAVADNERHPEFPDVPMLKEVWPEADAVSWGGLFAPVGTPDPIIRKLSAAIQKIAQDQDLRAQMQKVAVRPAGSTPEELAAELKKDSDRYARLVKELDIKLD